MRKPSLHITQDNLARVLYKVFPGKDCNELSKKILILAKSYSTSSRNIYVTNDKLLKKAEKVNLSNRSNSGLFAQTLLLCRRKLKHRGISLIKPTDRDWLVIKEITNLATEFCNEFQIESKVGYREYITIGLELMKNFSLQKFKSINTAIFNRYEAVHKINSDSDSVGTKKLHDIYLEEISNKIGFVQSYQDNPEKYQHFIDARETCRKLGVSGRDYILAQFEAFEWADSIPDPVQLHGQKAIERVQKYAFKNNIKLGTQRKVIDNPFKNLRNVKKGNN